MATSRTGTATWKRVRKAAIARAIREGQEQCPICGTLLDLHGAGEGAPVDVDHVQPWSLGGRDHVDAVRVTCRHCNRSRGNGTRNNKTNSMPERVIRKTFDTTVDW